MYSLLNYLFNYKSTSPLPYLILSFHLFSLYLSKSPIALANYEINPMAASDEPYPIVGIQDGLDPDKRQVLRKVPIRMELDDWYQSTEDVHVNQRALFFPAFQTFSELSPREKLSYFQIAGESGLRPL